jgi:hypothetical protein
MAGRAGADVNCRNSVPDELSSWKVAALLSFEPEDELRDMPTNLSFPEDEPLYAPTGRLLTASFQTLLSAITPWDECQEGSAPLLDLFAGLANPYYITGSTIDGALAANCAGWTDDGQVGLGDTLELAEGYFDAGSCTRFDFGPVTCDSPVGGPADATVPYVLCLAYK